MPTNADKNIASYHIVILNSFTYKKSPEKCTFPRYRVHAPACPTQTTQIHAQTIDACARECDTAHAKSIFPTVPLPTVVKCNLILFGLRKISQNRGVKSRRRNLRRPLQFIRLSCAVSMDERIFILKNSSCVNFYLLILILSNELSTKGINIHLKIILFKCWNELSNGKEFRKWCWRIYIKGKPFLPLSPYIQGCGKILPISWCQNSVGHSQTMSMCSAESEKINVVI